MLSHEENSHQFEYQTGSVPPTRQAGGIFAAGVFIVIAFLGIFIVTAAIGFRIFSSNTTPLLASLSNANGDKVSANAAHMDGEVLSCKEIGITCQSISGFCAEYYNLPMGIYVISVEKGTPADLQGVLPGDVLIALDDSPICLTSTLQYYISSNYEQESTSLLFVRDSQQFYVYISPEVS